MIGNEAHVVVKALIETSQRDEAGYSRAARHAYAPHFRTIFKQYATECAINAAELQICLGLLSDLVDVKGVARPLAIRRWGELKDSLNFEDDLNLLDVCEHGEDRARQLYEGVLKLPVTPEVRYVLRRHFEKIRHHQERIRDFRDRALLVEA